MSIVVVLCIFIYKKNSKLLIINLLQNTMKLLALLGLATIAVAAPADECPHNLEVLCIDDINKAYPVCEKAS
jgi:hypothetical protein